MCKAAFETYAEVHRIRAYHDQSVACALNVQGDTQVISSALTSVFFRRLAIAIALPIHTKIVGNNKHFCKDRIQIMTSRCPFPCTCRGKRIEGPLSIHATSKYVFRDDM